MSDKYEYHYDFEYQAWVIVKDGIIVYQTMTPEEAKEYCEAHND